MSGRAILTIGAYGWTATTFAAALAAAGVDVLVDVRARRGVRGQDYAFANSTRLQAMLEKQGIAYLHAKELAPSPDVRAIQHSRDAFEGTGKRRRSGLDPAFVRVYQEQILGTADIGQLTARLSAWSRPCLLCVESSPEACHRSLAADALLTRDRTAVEHVLP